MHSGQHQAERLHGGGCRAALRTAATQTAIMTGTTSGHGSSRALRTAFRGSSRGAPAAGRPGTAGRTRFGGRRMPPWISGTRQVQQHLCVPAPEFRSAPHLQVMKCASVATIQLEMCVPSCRRASSNSPAQLWWRSFYCCFSADLRESFQRASPRLASISLN